MNDGAAPSDRQPHRWFLLEGSRLIVAAIGLACFAAAVLAVLLVIGPQALQPSTPVYYLFSALLGGNFTVITIVVSVDQLVLSREPGSLGSLRERIEKTDDYREWAESTVGREASPPSPAGFLRFLHETVGRESEALNAAAQDAEDAHLREQVSSLADSLGADAAQVNRKLDASERGIFDVIAAILTTNHAEQIHEIDRLSVACGDDIGDELSESLNRLRTVLLQVDIARRYFVTVYVQKELASLSRRLLYVGVPSLAATALILVLYEATNAGLLARSVLIPTAAATIIVSFAPITVLAAFVLRLTWVSQQASSVTPFAAEE